MIVINTAGVNTTAGIEISKRKTNTMNFYQLVTINEVLLFKKRSDYPGYVSTKGNSACALADIATLRVGMFTALLPSKYQDDLLALLHFQFICRVENPHPITLERQYTTHAKRVEETARGIV